MAPLHCTQQQILLLVAIIACLLSPLSFAAQDGHGDHGHGNTGGHNDHGHGNTGGHNDHGHGNTTHDMTTSNSSANCTDVDWTMVNTSDTMELDMILYQQCSVAAAGTGNDHHDSGHGSHCPAPRVCEEKVRETTSRNLGIAFALTITAGMSTTIGAVIPLIPCIRKTNVRILTISLSLAAGVMLYVALVGIFNKTKVNICCATEDHFNLISNISFFMGILMTVLLDLLVTGMGRIDCGCPPWGDILCSLWKGEGDTLFKSRRGTKSDVAGLEEEGTNKETVGLSTVNPMVVRQDSYGETMALGEKGCIISPSSNNGAVPDTELQKKRRSSSIDSSNARPDGIAKDDYITSEVVPAEKKEDSADEKKVKELLIEPHKMRRMGILTGLALALHNFPEGLGTFVAALTDPTFGVVLAIAIATHNIPEGISVSMPIYYATGSRLKGFFWAFLTGIAEPLGALFGWAILHNIFGFLSYGILLGLVAGMMVYVALKELIPTAYKFDNTNGILVIVFIVIGMMVMALSLVLLGH